MKESKDIKEEVNTMNFNPKKKDEVIKRENCTYGFEGTFKYFICTCSGGEFVPICEDCFNRCHAVKKDHKVSKTGSAKFECDCGSKNHTKILSMVILKPNKLKKFENIEKKTNDCIYSKFEYFNVDRKYYEYNDDKESEVFCNICKSMADPKEYIQRKFERVTNAISFICKNTKLQLTNLQLSEFFINSKHLKQFFKSVNLNFIYIVPRLKEITINQIFGEAFKDIQKETIPDKIQLLTHQFFSKYKSYNILTSILYMIRGLKHNNIYLDKEKFFGSYDMDVNNLNFFVEMIKSSPPKDEKVTEFYYHSKFMLAKFVFVLFFESFPKKNNLMNFNFESICNLNVYQRYIYLTNSTNFYAFGYECEESATECKINLKNLGDFLNVLFDLIEFLLKTDLDKEIAKIFFNICKWLIKFNLMTINQIEKYTSIVADILNKQKNDKEEGVEDAQTGKARKDWESYNLTISKSLYLLLLYKNDNTVIEALRKGELNKKNNDIYIFVSTKSNDYLVNLYLKATFGNEWKNKVSLKSIKRENFYIRKAMDVLLGNGTSYKKNILNLKFIPQDQMSLFINSENNGQFNSEVKKLFIKEENLFRQISEISKKLTNLNAKYYSYEYNFEMYVDILHGVLGEIRKLINTEFTCIPPLGKKYLSVLPSDMGDEKNIAKIRQIREMVKFTNFFQALNGFLYIYSEEKIHTTLKVNLSEDMTTLLYFLYLLIKDDPQNIFLISILDPVCFTISFEDCDPYFYYFVEGLMDALFGKISEDQKDHYFLDNHYFYCKLIYAITDRIDFNSFDKNDEAYKIKMLQHLQFTLKYCRKPVKFLNWDDPSIIDLVEKILLKLKGLKYNEFIEDTLEEYFQFNKNSSQKDRIKNEIITKLLKNYFLFMNELMTSEFNFFNYVKPNDYLLTLPDVEQKVNLKDLPTLVRLVMLEFLNNNHFIIQLTSDNCNVSRLYKYKSDHKEKFFNYENLNVPNLTGSLKTENNADEVDLFLHRLNKKSDDFINKTMLIMKDVFLKADDIKPIVRRKIALVNFYERAIVRCSYNLINSYLAYSKHLNGNNLYKIYNIVFNFLKCTHIFYDKIRETDIIKDNIEEIQFLEKISIDRLEVIYIIHQIIGAEEDQKKFLSEIENDLSTLSKDYKYYHLDKVLDIYRSTVLKISKIENIQGYRGHVKNMINKILNDDKVYELQTEETTTKIDKLIEDYNKTLESTNGVQRSFVHVLETSEVEEFTPSGEYFIKYLIEQNNFEKFSIKKDNKQLYEFYQTFAIDSSNNLLFTPQNFYFYSVINFLFKHYTKNFQRNVYNAYITFSYYEQFKGSIKQLIKVLLYPSVVNECVKIYQLDKIHNYKPISLKLAQSLLKIFQNVCEGHNRKFQNLLFNLNIIEEHDTNFTDEDIDNLIIKSKKKKKDVIRIYKTLSAFSKLVDKREVESEQSKKQKEEEEKKKTIETKLKSKKIMEDDDDDDNDDDKKRDDEVSIGKGDGDDGFGVSMNVSDEEAEKRRKKRKRKDTKEDFKDNEEKNKETIAKHNESTNILEVDVSPDGNLGINSSKLLKSKRFDHEFNNVILRMITKKFSFLNFLFMNMELLTYHSNYPNVSSNLFYNNRKIKNIAVLEKLNIRFSDLITEMTQGCHIKKLHHFGISLPDYIDANNDRVNEEHFSILKYLTEMKKLFLENDYKIDLTTIKIKFQMFYLINNLLNQGGPKDTTFLQNVVLKYFPVSELAQIIIIYYKVLYKKYVIAKENDNILDIKNLNLTDECGEEMLKKYKASRDIFNDPIFKFITEIYLLLKILTERLNKEIIQLKETVNKQTTEGEEDKNIYNRDKLVVVKFFKEIVRQCEFIIRQDDPQLEDFEGADDKNNDFLPFADKSDQNYDDEKPQTEIGKSKIIFFVVDPYCELVSLNNIEMFLDTVDRSTSTSKLKELIQETNMFFIEVKYKSEHLIKDKQLEWRFNFIDYKKMDIFNFTISLIINTLLLLLLKDENFSDGFFYSFIIFLAVIQIFANFFSLYFYLSSKFSFRVLLEKGRLGLKEDATLTLKEKLDVYIFRSMFNDEIYLMYLNAFIPLICIFSKYALVLFPLQLFTILKFVGVIKEIVLAFKAKVGQFMEMIGFLAILILFYSNIGFFFMSSEFNLALDDGSSYNMCSSMLSCFILYFNFGIRSGGGIGDVIGMKNYTEGNWYWFRFFTDMLFYITVILLIMNMINGIIISTFSQIRENNEFKKEDEDNICFICNRKRGLFEKKKIHFDQHINKDHDTLNYVKYFITLMLLDESTLNSDQSYILECMMKKEISFFPVEKTLALPDSNENAGEDEEDD